MRIILKYSFVVILSLILLSRCGAPNYKVQFSGKAQGTYYAITYYDEESRFLKPEIDSLLKTFDLTASMWVSESIISKINNNVTDVRPNKWFIDLMELSYKIGLETQGAFDMTIGPLVNAWGFGFEDRMKLDRQKVDSLLQYVDFRKVKMINNYVVKDDPNIKFDFNGIAQGYSVDLVGDFLEEKGITSYLVDIGGEVYASGRKYGGEIWTVGIEEPADHAGYGESLNAIVFLMDKALATSGSYRQFYEEDGVRYSHTIDPETGYPVTHNLLSVSVMADDCATADGFATAFMVMGREASMNYLEGRPGLEAYFIEDAGEGEFEINYTEGFGKYLKEQ
jgi:thiamine biosynthesis lipoprotein